MKTIEVMKQAKDWMLTGDTADRYKAIKLLDDWIKCEAAQSEEPSFWVAPHGIGFRVHMGAKKPDYANMWEPLFTHPTPAKTPLDSERAELISRLRGHSTKLGDKAADMLEADAVRADERVASIAADREYWREKAQEPPQTWPATGLRTTSMRTARTAIYATTANVSSQATSAGLPARSVQMSGTQGLTHQIPSHPEIVKVNK